MSSNYGTAAAQVEAPDTSLGLLNTALGLATDIEVGIRMLADGVSGSIPMPPNDVMKQPQSSDLNSQLRTLIKSLKNATDDFWRARNSIGV